jgi:tetratricopeptide (TPR) repeat protein
MGQLLTDAGKIKAAKNAFRRLVSSTTNKRERYYGFSGLMKLYFGSGDYDSTLFYANTIRDQANVNLNAENESVLYRGKVHYARQNLDLAMESFLEIVNEAKDETGAEAQYMIAQILFDQGLFKQSIETLYDLNNSFPNYEYWLGKSFILIAENFIQLEEYFQAKETLLSLIEYSPLDEIVKHAKIKLDHLDSIENENMVGADSINSLVESDSLKGSDK